MGGRSERRRRNVRDRRRVRPGPGGGVPSVAVVATVAVDPALRWPGSDVLAERAGGCYTLSMEFVLANYAELGEWLTLVHGLLRPERSSAARSWADEHPELPLPPTNPHAWVEIAASDDVLAVDPVLRQAWPVAEHRELFGAEVIRAYRADVAISIASRREDFGPWDRRSLAAWSERQEAAKADPRFSQQAAVDRFLRTTA